MSRGEEVVVVFGEHVDRPRDSADDGATCGCADGCRRSQPQMGADQRLVQGLDLRVESEQVEQPRASGARRSDHPHQSRLERIGVARHGTSPSHAGSVGEDT